MPYPEASEGIAARLLADLAEDEAEQTAPSLAERATMERLAALLAAEDVMARPAPEFTQRVMGRVRRRRRLYTVARWGLVGLLGLVVGMALCMAPLASPASPLTHLMENPSAFSSVVRVVVEVLDLAGTLVGALGLVARAVLASPGYVGLIALVGVASLLAVLWFRVVMRASRVVGRA